MISKYFFLLNAIMVAGSIFKSNASEHITSESPGGSDKSISDHRLFMHFREYCSLEFTLTSYSLSLVVQDDDMDKIKGVFSDMKTIKNEIVRTAREHHRLILDDTDSDNMAIRVSDRLLSLCEEIKKTHDYFALLKNIFWSEKRALEDAFIQIIKIEDVREKKKYIDNVSVLMGFFKKYLGIINVTLSEDQMYRTGVRMSKFLSDVFGLSFRMAKTLPVIPPDSKDDAPPS